MVIKTILLTKQIIVNIARKPSGHNISRIIIYIAKPVYQAKPVSQTDQAKQRMEPWVNELLEESPGPKIPKWIKRTASEQVEFLRIGEMKLKVSRLS